MEVQCFNITYGRQESEKVSSWSYLSRSRHSRLVFSALSLRVFGKEISTSARDTIKKNESEAAQLADAAEAEEALTMDDIEATPEVEEVVIQAL